MRLYGKNPVLERLRFNPKSVRKIFIQEGIDAALIQQKARQNHIPFFIVPRSRILKMSRNTNTQGVVVDCDDFSYIDYDELLENALNKKRTVLFLDSLTDPQNLGSIFRTAACLGKFSIVLPTHDSVGVTEVVLRVACGGENYVPIARVSNLANALRRAKTSGFNIVGTVVKEGQPLTEISFPYPLALVIGSEQSGIRPTILKVLDGTVTVPMSVDTISLNVAQAAAIICYEINRQRLEYRNEKAKS